MNWSYSPSMTCSKVLSGCLQLIFTICLWYHFLASLVRKLSRWRMHSLSWSFPPYCLALNITTRFDNQSSRSLNLGVPPYLLTELLLVLQTLLPLGMTHQCFGPLVSTIGYQWLPCTDVPLVPVNRCKLGTAKIWISVRCGSHTNPEMA